MTAAHSTPTVVPVPSPVLLPVRGTEARFPVRRVFCVGRNYADHAREMGHDPDREPPFFFMKPADAMIPCPAGTEEGAGAASSPSSETPIAYPPLTADLHHEVELAVAIGAPAVDVQVDRALECVWGYAVAIDLTRRDLQADAKALRRPWDLSKGFDESGPIGEIVPASAIGHPDRGRISLTVDGEVRQQGDLAQQIWSVPEIIAELSRSVALRPGDLVLTGTPSGVGPLERGARVAAAIEGVSELRCTLR